MIQNLSSCLKGIKSYFYLHFFTSTCLKGMGLFIWKYIGNILSARIRINVPQRHGFIDTKHINKLTHNMPRRHFFAPFGLPNGSIFPKDNKGDSVCEIEIYSLLSFSKTYISVQESYWYVNLGSNYDRKCPKVVP